MSRARQAQHRTRTPTAQLVKRARPALNTCLPTGKRSQSHIRPAAHTPARWQGHPHMRALAKPRSTAARLPHASARSTSGSVPLTKSLALDAHDTVSEWPLTSKRFKKHNCCRDFHLLWHWLGRPARVPFFWPAATLLDSACSQTHVTAVASAKDCYGGRAQ